MIGPLYHWSPRSRRSDIEIEGLTPGKTPVSILEGGSSDDGFRQEGVCFSLDPQTAWNYSQDVFGVPGIYDLWQVWVVDEDAVEIQPSYGAYPFEVRILGTVSPHRLVWVGEREL